jgi:hypothetical protein
MSERKVSMTVDMHPAAADRANAIGFFNIERAIEAKHFPTRHRSV